MLQGLLWKFYHYIFSQIATLTGYFWFAVGETLLILVSQIFKEAEGHLKDLWLNDFHFTKLNGIAIAYHCIWIYQYRLDSFNTFFSMF